MQKLKELLKQECDYCPSDTTLNAFLNEASRVNLRGSEILIHCGETDSGLFIVKEGILRFADMNGDKERTFAFALPGTVFMSKHSFVRQMPSDYQVEACCESVVLRVPRTAYDKLVATNHDFTRWMLSLSQIELFFQEYKNSSVNNGSAGERFDSLLRLRPEIIANVPSKVIASYLGITPEYFCRLKKRKLTSR